jgi:hypothetical protein
MPLPTTRRARGREGNNAIAGTAIRYFALVYSQAGIRANCRLEPKGASDVESLSIFARRAVAP